MKQEFRSLQEQLRAYQRKLFEANRAAIILVESMPGAGRGHMIGNLTQYLDPRFFRLQEVFPEPAAKGRMLLEPYWRLLPGRKQLAVFSGSWYTSLLQQKLDKKFKSKHRPERYLQEFAEFERLLLDDSLILQKYWLQISKKEQKKRFKRYEKDQLESWRVKASDWKAHKKYEKYTKVRDELIQSSAPVSWSTIDCDDLDSGLLEFLTQVNENFKAGLS